MRSDFCAFILTHGRPNDVITYKQLQIAGYTGKIYIVIDNEDSKADEYYKRFGAEVIMFDKKAMSKTFDEADNFDNRKSIVYARNVCFKLAKDLGIKYFIQLDDDYTWFGIRTAEKSHRITNIDTTFEYMVDFIINTPVSSIAMSQGGDHIGGYKPDKKVKRKAMNSFICSVDKPFTFLGRINEDVNTYVQQASIGLIFFTIMNLQLIQKATQATKGGMTDIYMDGGTYIKSFYTILFAPSSVTIKIMGQTNKRLHHSIKWDHAVPKILSEKYKKL